MEPDISSNSVALARPARLPIQRCKRTVSTAPEMKQNRPTPIVIPIHNPVSNPASLTESAAAELPVDAAVVVAVPQEHAAGHCVQLELAEVGLYKPEAHTMHAVPLALNVPAGHASQSPIEELLGWYPAPQRQASPIEEELGWYPASQRQSRSSS